MKKKFVSFLILACAIVSIGLVGSCKDYADDMVRDLELTQDKNSKDFNDSLKSLRNAIKANRDQIKANKAELDKKLSNLEKRYKADSVNQWKELNDYVARIKKLEGQMTALQGKEKADSATIMKALQNDTAAIWAQIRVDEGKHKADTAQLWKAIRALQSANNDLENALADSLDNLRDEFADSLAALMNRVNQKIAAAAGNVQATDSAWELADSIRGAILGWGDQITTAYSNAEYALALAKRDSIRIDALSDSLAKYATIDTVKAIAEKNLAEAKAYTDQLADSLADVLKDMKKEYKKMIKDLSKELKDMMEEKLKPIRENLKDLNEKVKKNIEAIEKLDERVSDLEEKIKDVEKLKNAEEKRIVSLLVQGAKTPAFGSFSLPVGIRSNILMAYFGEFGSTVEFPTTATANFVGNVADQFQSDEADALRFNRIAQSFEAGYNVADADDNAGKLYLTVNPNNVALDNTYEFTLVNSKGVENKAVLGNLRPSTDLLTFGYTRATVDAADTENGFYEADVKINKEDVKALEPNTDELKSIAKKIIEDKTKVNLTDVTRSLLESLDGLLEANAVLVTWEDSLGEHKVRSGYDVAVAAVQPLSFHTSLSGLSSRKLPVDPIGDMLASLNISAVDIEVSPINLGDASLNFPAVTYDKGVSSVVVETRDLLGNVTGTATVPYASMQAEIASLAANINGANDKYNDDIKATVAKIESQVNARLATIEAEVEREIDKIIDKVLTEVGSSDLTKRINKVLKRVNRFVDNADNLFDITLLYNGADDEFHPASASKAVPSLFNGLGDYTIYPTSYNAELLTPAFKKYIAVTNVYKTDDPSISAKGGDTAAKSVMNLTNSKSEGFIKVLEGNVASVTFHPQNIGYTYEIVYSALDYHGKISTRRFYVTVK